MADQSFSKLLRLRSRGDFRLVYERRCSVGDGLVRVLGRLSELERPRMGLSVSKQVGNAVARNCWKRLLREAFRTWQEKLPAGLDFVVVPRAEATPELKQLAKSLVELTWRLQKRLKREAAAARRDSVAEENHAKAQRRKEEE
jgi:ribonuclease P protein component